MVDSDCSHEIKRRLLLGRKVMTNQDSVLKKQKHHLIDKGPHSPSYGFSSRHVHMWELDRKEGWALKNWSFCAVVRCGEDLRIPWEARRSNQSILKEINPEYSLERLMLRLQYFGHLTWTANSLKRPWCWERLKAKEGGERGSDG